jgi:hypothetical protein
MKDSNDYEIECIEWIRDNYESLQAKAEIRRNKVLAKGIFKTTFIRDWDGYRVWLTYDYNKNDLIEVFFRLSKDKFVCLEIEGMCKPSEKRVRTCADCVNLGAWVGYGVDKTAHIHLCELLQCPVHANAGACVDIELKKP